MARLAQLSERRAVAPALGQAVAAVSELVRARGEPRVVAVAQLGGGVRDQRDVGQVDALAGVQHELDGGPVARLGVRAGGDAGAALAALPADADAYPLVTSDRLARAVGEFALGPVDAAPAGPCAPSAPITPALPQETDAQSREDLSGRSRVGENLSRCASLGPARQL